jgi:hypothetical protein
MILVPTFMDIDMLKCCRTSWLGGRSRKARKVTSKCRTDQRPEGSATARQGRCQGRGEGGEDAQPGRWWPGP